MDRNHPVWVRALRWCLYYLVLVPVLFVILKLGFGLKITGRENFLRNRGSVITCNHIHYLDCTMVVLAAFPKHVTFATLNSNFRMPVVGGLLRQFECVAVGENLKETRAFLEDAKRRLKERKSVCLYPEGELELYSREIRPFQKGAFSLAVNAEAVIQPMVLHQRPPKGMWRLFKRKPLFTLEVLPALRPEDLPQGLSSQQKYTRLMEEASSRMKEALKKSRSDRTWDS